jgi:hypothetical protein
MLLKCLSHISHTSLIFFLHFFSCFLDIFNLFLEFTWLLLESLSITFSTLFSWLCYPPAASYSFLSCFSDLFQLISHIFSLFSASWKLFLTLLSIILISLLVVFRTSHSYISQLHLSVTSLSFISQSHLSVISLTCFSHIFTCISLIFTCILHILPPSRTFFSCFPIYFNWFLCFF